MLIAGVTFHADGACVYDRLADVWRYSAQKAHPEAKVKLYKMPSQSRTSHQRRNQYKLTVWNDIVQKAEQPVILMDVDMLVLQDISDVFEQEFDVCYTRRTKTRMPLNGGVLFVKPTAAAREFFNLWTIVDGKLLRDRRKYENYIRTYGGQNQASFGYLLEQGKHSAKITSVECTIYNCCNEEWHAIDEHTRVVHCKGALKRILSKSGGHKTMHEKYTRAYNLWYSMYNEMRQAR